MGVDRHDFAAATIRQLSDRVGSVCSNPECGAATRGPHSDEDKATNVGAACHIHAAAPGGPRYDPHQTEEERRSISNGIWLCRTCGTLVDADEARFPAPLLRLWRAQAEYAAYQRLGRPAAAGSAPTDAPHPSAEALDVMRYLADAYIKAGYPNFKVWMFTPPDQNDPKMGELRALGLVYFLGPRGGPWRLTEEGVAWIMRNR